MVEAGCGPPRTAFTTAFTSPPNPECAPAAAKRLSRPVAGALTTKRMQQLIVSPVTAKQAAPTLMQMHLRKLPLKSGHGVGFVQHRRGPRGLPTWPPRHCRLRRAPPESSMVSASSSTSHRTSPKARCPLAECASTRAGVPTTTSSGCLSARVCVSHPLPGSNPSPHAAPQRPARVYRLSLQTVLHDGSPSLKGGAPVSKL